MLRIVNLEEFHRLLLRVPALVDDLESRTADAPGAVRDWLVEVEGALENNRMPLAGNIAGLSRASTLHPEAPYPAALSSPALLPDERSDTQLLPKY